MFSKSRQSLRSLLHHPGFTIPAVLTLALSIGITTAVFSVLYGIVIRRLPYANPGQLVLVSETDLHNDSPREAASLPDFRDWQAQSRSFSGLAGFTEEDMTLSDPSAGAERLPAAHVTYNLFPLLGVEPLLGRTFKASDDLPASAPVVLISEDIWKSRFGGDPSILGRSIRIESSSYAIVGVLPTGSAFPAGTQIWTALEPHVKEFQRLRGVHGTEVVGRLRQGVGIASAQKEMDVIARRLEQAYRADNEGRGARVEFLHDVVVGNTRPVLLVLFAAALLVLLIGCANVAGLMFVRSGQRARETAIRFALGASRAAILLRVLGEALLVAVAGSAAGVALAAWGVGALLAIAPESLPRRNGIELNVPVLLFAIAAGAAACILSGLLPAIAASRERLQGSIRTASATGAHADRQRRWRRLLIVGEIAIAVVLAIGALLLLRSYGKLIDVGPGVSNVDLIAANIRLPEGKYPTPSRKQYPAWPQAIRVYDEILEHCGRIDGVKEVAIALNHPLRPGWTSQVTVPGRLARSGPPDEVRVRPVTAGYARTVGLPLLAGRGVAATDRLGSEFVLMINQAMARKFFPREDPVGRQVTLWGTPRKIVGVVGDERFLGLNREVQPAIYPPLYQMPMGDVYLVVRSSRPLAQTLPDIRSAIESVDPDIPLSDARTLENLISRSVAPQRFTMIILAVFGALALLLAAVGVFGIIAYQVSLRLRELGIRTALGAGRPELILLMLREAAALTAAGVIAGWLGALSLTRFLERFLFGVTPLDAVTFVAAALVLASVGIAAAAVPAIRASRVDPMLILRAE